MKHKKRLNVKSSHNYTFFNATLKIFFNFSCRIISHQISVCIVIGKFSSIPQLIWFYVLQLFVL